MQPDVHISNVRMRLDPRHGRVPFEPLVESLFIELSASAFVKIVEQGVIKAAGRAPVDIELASARLVDGGAEIVTRVKRSILKAELKVSLTFLAHDPRTIRIRIANIDAPAWVPTQFVIDQGMNMAANRPGFSRVSGDDRAVDVNPAEILLSRGIPMKLAEPGMWTVTPTAESIGVGYQPTA